MKTQLSLILFITAVSGIRAHKIAVYWGQDSAFRGKEKIEADLEVTCRDYKYDTILLAFNDMISDSRNKDKLPGINFDGHCNETFGPEYKTLLRCSKIEKGIEECQKKEIKVLLSIGGPTADGTLPSPAKAREFAGIIWNLFLGGKQHLHDLRPFGKFLEKRTPVSCNPDHAWAASIFMCNHCRYIARKEMLQQPARSILDGINLSIEGGQALYWDIFATEIRRYDASDQERDYLITASPSCRVPDHFLGHALKQATLFDEIYVKFYNEECGNGETFDPELLKLKGKIFFGVPADPQASSSSKFFKKVAKLQQIYKGLKKEPKFGGFMIWDASYDQSNIIDGKVYSEHIADFLSKEEVEPPSTPNPAPPPPPAKPGTVSCEGKADGLYSHPTDCAKYVQCIQGQATVKSCQDGLLFNPKTKACDFAEQVDCEQ